MAITTITPEGAIAKYKELYPQVENMLLETNGMYKRGLNDLREQYEDLNLTGAEKARYIAQYVLTANMNLIASSQKVTLDLLTAAYSLESDIALKQAQIDLVKAQEENVEADTAYKEKQLEVLAFSNILNALIKVFQSLSEMQGSMGAGKLVIPARMMAIMRESVIACLRLIQKDSTYGNVFNQTVGSYSDIIKYLVSGLSYAAFTATDDTVTSK